jgi:hypothetical protein
LPLATADSMLEGTGFEFPVPGSKLRKKSGS